ncbi:MAG: hypothetical protein L6Q81_10280 [Bacteroidia bacterium]|nr:hypothetical protein [Bacteroidia bacterium]
MKTALRLALALTLLQLTANAQNLVPNPGFENLKQVPCNPMFGDPSAFISDWKQGSQGTADILSRRATPTCYANTNSSSGMSIGSENPHGGDNMGMIMTSVRQDYREYLGAVLTQPLVPGKRYYAEVYVTLADRSGFGTNNIGFLFRTGEFKTASGYQIIEKPQINNTEIITTMNGWVKVSGTFTATEACTHFIIGNFLPEADTKKQIIKAGNTDLYHDHSAYYIDDVCIKLASDLTAAGDSVVAIGATATLTASGGSSYKWFDVSNPNVIIGTDAVLKIKVSRKTTFRVKSGDDYIDLTVNVRKTTPAYTETINGRKVRKGRNVIVHHEEIVIQVHDKNEVDGDSIALYYGDSLVTQHVSLGKRKQSFTIKVDKYTPRQLILYAENLGSVPPNTAALTIKDGRDTTDVVLGSDFKFCDSVLLTYKED